MENQVQVAYHEHFGKVRVVILNGTVYFVGRDAAKALGFKNTEGAIKKHVEKEDKIIYRPSEMGGQVRGAAIVTGSILINESGLWSLVLRSKLPSAKEFQRWLTSEVIPEIMRTGSYNAPPDTRLTTEFTRREKIEMLFKLLNYPNLPLTLRNRIVTNIVFLLSADLEKILTHYFNEE